MALALPPRRAGSSCGGDTVKVLDFGLAKLRTASDQTESFTSPGVVMGTAGYMSPEQLMGAGVRIRTQTRRWHRHPDQSHRGCLNVRLPAPRLARSVYFPLPDHVKR